MDMPLSEWIPVAGVPLVCHLQVVPMFALLMAIQGQWDDTGRGAPPEHPIKVAGARLKKRRQVARSAHQHGTLTAEQYDGAVRSAVAEHAGALAHYRQYGCLPPGFFPSEAESEAARLRKAASMQVSAQHGGKVG